MEVLIAGIMFIAGMHAYDEPHYTLRDGCKAETVAVAGTNLVQDSYASCKNLPRVYGGKAWTPHVSKAAE